MYLTRLTNKTQQTIHSIFLPLKRKYFYPGFTSTCKVKEVLAEGNSWSPLLDDSSHFQHNSSCERSLFTSRMCLFNHKTYCLSDVFFQCRILSYPSIRQTHFEVNFFESLSHTNKSTDFHNKLNREV